MVRTSIKLKIKQKLRPFFARKRLFFFDKRCFSSFRFLKQQFFFSIKKNMFSSIFFSSNSLSSFFFVTHNFFSFFRAQNFKKFNHESLQFSNQLVNRHFFINSFFCKKFFL